MRPKYIAPWRPIPRWSFLDRVAAAVELYRDRWHRRRATGGARCFRLVWGGAPA